MLINEAVVDSNGVQKVSQMVVQVSKESDKTLLRAMHTPFFRLALKSVVELFNHKLVTFLRTKPLSKGCMKSLEKITVVSQRITITFFTHNFAGHHK